MSFLKSGVSSLSVEWPHVVCQWFYLKLVLVLIARRKWKGLLSSDICVRPC